MALQYPTVVSHSRLKSSIKSKIITLHRTPLAALTLNNKYLTMSVSEESCILQCRGVVTLVLHTCPPAARPVPDSQPAPFSIVSTLPLKTANYDCSCLSQSGPQCPPVDIFAFLVGGRGLVRYYLNIEEANTTFH